MNDFLVVIETQRVKDYLFGSRYLRETRGASLLLDGLNRVKTRELLKEPQWKDAEEVYLGGGSGRVLFPTREGAQAFADAVRELYRQESGDARVAAEVVEREPGEQFTAWVARGVAESQSNKLGRIEAVPVLGGRWIRPCTSCGRRPAQEIPAPDVQGRHLLCRSCLLKRQAIRDFYRQAKRNFDLWTPIPGLRELRQRWPDTVLLTLTETVERRFGKRSRVLLPVDFEDIGARSRPLNYFGLIYADGNRMGETIRAIGDHTVGDDAAKRSYAAFSRIVDQATRSAAVEAVLAEVEVEDTKTRQGEPAKLIPAEFVIAGGDDLILVVPAQAALAVAERFLTLFQERSRELQADYVRRRELDEPFDTAGLTTSAGVALAHDSYPASQLVGHAVELMKLAKHRASDLATEAVFEGAADFAVIHESGSESLKQRRDLEYRDRLSSGKTLRRTERPYTASELRRLLARIRALKESAVPRVKLKALYAALFQTPVQAQFEALRIQERLKVTGALEQVGPLAELVAELNFFPFRELDAKTWTTPLTELIELFDFVPAAAPPQAAAHNKAPHA